MNRRYSERKHNPTIYYAHGMYLYGSAQEERDIETLERLGFTVVNPAASVYAEEAEAYGNKMAYYKSLVAKCDALAFRGTPEGSITSGVAEEIDTANSLNMPVFELPSGVKRRALNIGRTLEYLHEIGER